MQKLHFDDCEDLVCNAVAIFGAIRENDEYNDVAFVAKYEEARQIIKELVSFGYDLRSIQLEDNCYGGYDAEYIISICNIDGEDEIWCEPMLREDGYISDESTVIYVLDNCSSKVIPYCNGTVVYEISIGEECDCDECCGCCECEDDNNTECTVKSDDDGYSITVRCNLDANEAMEMIKDMENRMERMNDMFREMDYFRRLLRW